MDFQKLQGMKYAELQKVAKECGVRANMKADKLLKALEEFYKGSEKENGKLLKNKTPQPKIEKRKRSADIVKSPRTPQAKRLKIQSTPLSKVKNTERQLQVGSPVVGGTPGQGESKPVTPASQKPNHVRSGTYEKKDSAQKSAETATPASQKPNHVRRGTYEKKDSTQKSVETDSKGGRSRSKEGGRHKRSGTYEKVSDGQPAKVGDESSADSSISKKHKRKGTFTKEEEDERLSEKFTDRSNTGSDMKENEISPGVQRMINAMNEDMTSEEMKASLMKELDKRAKDKVPEKSDLSDSDSSQIPRYTALGANKLKKPTTPSGKFQQAHRRQFEKMESIDQWVDRKQQRNDALGTSMKKLHQLTQQMRSAVESAKKYQTPPSLLKKSQSAVSGRSKASLFQSPSSKPFVPTVTSISKADFRFLKSPARQNPATRKSPRMPGSGRENKPGNISLNVSQKVRTGGTPFKFRGNTSLINKSQNSTLNGSALAKPKFDLHASLQRPVTWKTHKGKVKPLGGYNSGTERIKGDQRQKVQTSRSDKRLDMQMKRRGFVP